MSARLNDTQPNKPSSQVTQPSALGRKVGAPRPAPEAASASGRGPGCLRGLLRSPLAIVSLSVLAGLLLVSGAGAAAGWALGSGDYNATATMQTGMYLLEQYNLALGDMDAGDFGLARERLEFIYGQNANFLDVRQKLLEVLVITGSTSTEQPAGPTATPTLDPRPKEQLYQAALGHLRARDWTAAIETLLALRQADASYFTAQVDGWLYAALRNRGAQNITQHGLFEQGLYDFALAGTFGPLDSHAENYRQWARLYLYGNAFWLAYPLDAAYYYGQLVSLAPDLRDANGISAFGRYWQSLLHHAEQLAAEGEWCAAQEAYQNVQNARQEGSLLPTQEFVALECLGPSETPSPIPSQTNTLSASLTPSATFTVDPGASNTPTLTPSQTLTPSETLTPSHTPSETPSLTPTP
ncbi:MAG: hypothetical protein KIT46_11130 [Anaerolineales bacterium]|nr:hypothetical protein [Anaerolineales bacterium]MCW5856587.1 hypothetical protein [Anaerolineales bacterium]